jgi:hypothetical protein
VVCRPTDFGGLGVLDLRFFSFALRLRCESCWAKLPAKSEKAVAAMAAVSMSVSIGDGSSCRLWTDCWATVGPLNLFAPELFAAISRTGIKRTLKDGLLNNRWARDIVGTPTVQVLCQYLRVWRILGDVVLDPVQEDRFVWKWLADGKYSASLAYRTGLSSLAHPPCSAPKRFGRPRRRPASNFSSGLHSTVVSGQLHEGRDMGCRMMMPVCCVSRSLKPVTIYSSAVCS